MTSQGLCMHRILALSCFSQAIFFPEVTPFVCRHRFCWRDLTLYKSCRWCRKTKKVALPKICAKKSLVESGLNYLRQETLFVLKVFCRDYLSPFHLQAKRSVFHCVHVIGSPWVVMKQWNTLHFARIRLKGKRSNTEGKTIDLMQKSWSRPCILGNRNLRNFTGHRLGRATSNNHWSE